MNLTRTPVTSLALDAHEDYCRAGVEGERLEVRGKDLTGMSLVETLLAGAIFEDCGLQNADLTGADLTGVSFVRCDLTRANLSDSCLNNAQIEASSFDDAKLVGAEMSSCFLSRSSFQRANLMRANLYKATLEDVSLARARAAHARLKRALVTRCDLSDADLSELDSGRATFRSVDLRRSLMRAMRLDFTAFHDCAFAGVMGLPQVDGKVQIVDPDVSPVRDRSSIRDLQFFRDRWGNPWDPPGAWVVEPE